MEWNYVWGFFPMYGIMFYYLYKLCWNKLGFLTRKEGDGTRHKSYPQIAEFAPWVLRHWNQDQNRQVDFGSI